MKLTLLSTRRAGGKKILIRNAGTDSSEVFWKFHNKRVIEKTAVPFKIGTIGEVTVETPVDEADEDNEYFGDLVPFGGEQKGRVILATMLKQPVLFKRQIPCITKDSLLRKSTFVYVQVIALTLYVYPVTTTSRTSRFAHSCASSRILTSRPWPTNGTKLA